MTTNSNFRAWLQVTRVMESDGGHFVEFKDGRVILDGMVDLPSFAAARELMLESV